MSGTAALSAALLQLALLLLLRVLVCAGVRRLFDPAMATVAWRYLRFGSLLCTQRHAVVSLCLFCTALRCAVYPRPGPRVHRKHHESLLVGGESGLVPLVPKAFPFLVRVKIPAEPAQ